MEAVRKKAKARNNWPYIVFLKLFTLLNYRFHEVAALRALMHAARHFVKTVTINYVT